MTTRNFITIATIFLQTFFCAAQQNEIVPEAGKPMPDFTLSEITHFKKTKASLADFKGKWLVLDFWMTTCKICIHSFPKVNSWHQEFKNDLNWIMVGQVDQQYNKGIRELYENFRGWRNLEMASAYDSVLIKKWGIWSFPHIIIVDPLGKVRYITGGRNLTTEKIRDLLAGKNISLVPKDMGYNEFDVDKLLDTDVGDQLLYRSAITKWNGENQMPWDPVECDRMMKDPENVRKGYMAAMVPLEALYNYAYIGKWSWHCTDTTRYGKYYKRPILEVNDSSLFRYDFMNNVGEGTYNYNLVLPRSEYSSDKIMAQLRHDLKTVFKFEVSLETRVIPVWKLVAVPDAIEKLRTKEGRVLVQRSAGFTGITLKNAPHECLIEWITGFLKGSSKSIFIDDTGISGNIDFTMDGDMTSKESVLKELRKQGLDLVRGTKEMKVIVIRDSKKL